jgi:thiol-disulfide isomerase/thioredoxin
MNRRDWLAAAAATLVAGRAGAAGPERLPQLPRRAEDWLNGAPPALDGHPVLVEFWTFGCYNCRNMLPWMKAVHERYAAGGLAIVAVHTPEFPTERDAATVANAVRRLAIAYPVLLDPDARIWAAFANRYWPAVYLYDRRHRLVDTAIGELHLGTSRGDSIEARIRAAVSA